MYGIDEDIMDEISYILWDMRFLHWWSWGYHLSGILGFIVALMCSQSTRLATLVGRTLLCSMAVVGVVRYWVQSCLECKCWLCNTSVNWSMGCDGGTIPKRDELVRKKKKPEQVSVCHLKLWFLISSRCAVNNINICSNTSK